MNKTSVKGEKNPKLHSRAWGQTASKPSGSSVCSPACIGVVVPPGGVHPMPLVPQRGRHWVWEAEHGLRLGWDPGILGSWLLDSSQHWDRQARFTLGQSREASGLALAGRSGPGCVCMTHDLPLRPACWLLGSGFSSLALLKPGACPDARAGCSGWGLWPDIK